MVAEERGLPRDGAQIDRPLPPPPLELARKQAAAMTMEISAHIVSLQSGQGTIWGALGRSSI